MYKLLVYSFAVVFNLRRYIKRFTAEMERTDFCNDQGVLNVMVHTGALGRELNTGGGRKGGSGDATTMTVWRHEDGRD
jgi:hypothetical protein